MRTLWLLLAAAVLGPAVDARAAGKVVLGDCGGSAYGGRVEPVLWDRGCTGVADLTEMRWTGWGGKVASGSGLTQRNDCVPSCAEGTVAEYPVEAELSRIRRCKDAEGRVGRYYTHVRMRYELPADNPYGVPGGPQDEPYDLGCIRPSAPNRCGTLGDVNLPGHAYDIRADRVRCTPARRLVRRAQRRRCGASSCAVRKSLRVAGYRCRFGGVELGRFFQRVECSRGGRRVRFRVAYD